MSKQRIILAGVGGQGTLTATNLLALMALDKNIPVTSGEIHGMAQRGGVVESTLLFGGYLSPRISVAEADILLGFEPMETLRALPYLKPGGLVISNSEPTLPGAVTLGKETYPSQETIQDRVARCASETHFIPCKSLGLKAGTVQSANLVLLGGFCSTQAGPFNMDDLKAGIEAHLPQKIVSINLQAVELGRLALGETHQEH